MSEAIRERLAFAFDGASADKSTYWRHFSWTGSGLSTPPVAPTTDFLTRFDLANFQVESRRLYTVGLQRVCDPYALT